VRRVVSLAGKLGAASLALASATAAGNTHAPSPFAQHGKNPWLITSNDESFEENNSSRKRVVNSLSGVRDAVSVLETGSDKSSNAQDSGSQSGGLVTSCPPTVTVSCGSQIPAAATTLTEFEALGGTSSASTVTVTSSDAAPTGSVPCNYSVARTYILTDTRSNSVECIQTINVVDLTAPVFVDCPRNISVPAGPGPCSAAVSWTPPTASDDCGEAGIVASHAPGSVFLAGTTRVTYTATDVCGLSSECSFNVTVTPGSPTIAYVDVNWIGTTPGTDPDGAGPAQSFGCDAFATIQGGIDAVTSGGTVFVAAGNYAESTLTLAKSITLTGPQAGVNACGRVASEAIVTPAIAGTHSLLIDGSNYPAGIVIDGFTLSGSSAFACVGLENGSAPSMQFLNNRVHNFTGIGVFWNRSVVNGLFSGNEVDGSAQTGSGALVQFDGADAFHGLQFTNNCLQNTISTGLFVDGNHNWTANAPAILPPAINGNLLTNCGSGMNLGSRSFNTTTAPRASMSGNTFSDNGSDGLQAGAQNTDITRNTFSNNGRTGLVLTGFGNAGADRGAQNCVTAENVFEGSGQEDVFFSAGQAVGTISTNTLFNNALGSTNAVT